MIDQVIVLLGFLSTVSVAVLSFTESVKSTWFSKFQNPDLQLIAIYLTRFFASLIGLYLFGGAATLRAMATFIPATAPDLGLLIVAALFVTGGNELLHPIVDYFVALRDNKRSVADQNAQTAQLQYDYPERFLPQTTHVTATSGTSKVSVDTPAATPDIKKEG